MQANQLLAAGDNLLITEGTSFCKGKLIIPAFSTKCITCCSCWRDSCGTPALGRITVNKLESARMAPRIAAELPVAPEVMRRLPDKLGHNSSFQLNADE